MAEVSADSLDDLMHAVDRLQELGAASCRTAEGGDAMTLFDALCEVYAASQRLIDPYRRASPTSVEA